MDTSIGSLICYKGELAVVGREWGQKWRVSCVARWGGLLGHQSSLYKNLIDIGDEADLWGDVPVKDDAKEGNDEGMAVQVYAPLTGFQIGAPAEY